MLENQFRHLGGGAGYAGGFVDHYVAPIVYPAGLTRGLQVALGGVAIAVNAVVYGGLLIRQRCRTPAEGGADVGTRRNATDR